MISTNFFPNDPVPPVTSIDSRDQLIISYAFKNSPSGYGVSFVPGQVLVRPRLRRSESDNVLLDSQFRGWPVTASIAESVRPGSVRDARFPGAGWRLSPYWPSALR